MASLALMGGVSLATGGVGVAAGSAASVALGMAGLAASYVDSRYIMPKLFGKENGDKGPDGLENFRMSTTRPGAARWNVYGGRAWVPCHFMWTKNIRSEVSGGGGGGKGGPAKPFVHTVFMDTGIAVCNGQIDEIDTMYADESPFWSKNFNRAKIESPRMVFSRHSSGRLKVSMPDLTSQDFTSVFSPPLYECDLRIELYNLGPGTRPTFFFELDKSWDVLLIEGVIMDPLIGYDINGMWKVHSVYKHGETGYNEPSHMELVHHVPDTDLDTLPGFTSSSATSGTSFNPATIRRIDYCIPSIRSPNSPACGTSHALIRQDTSTNVGQSLLNQHNGVISLLAGFSFPYIDGSERRATAQSWYRNYIGGPSNESDFWKVGSYHRIYGLGRDIEERIFEITYSREVSSNLDKWYNSSSSRSSHGLLSLVLKVAFGEPLTPPEAALLGVKPVSLVRVGGENGSFLNVDPEQTSKEYLGYNDVEYQPIDPTLQAAKSSGDIMSAYLGYAYLSLGNWNLGPHGNIIPRVTAMVTPSKGESVASAIKRICSTSMDPDYSDTQILRDRSLVGYSVSAGTPVVQALQPLAIFYDLTIQDRGGVMTFLDREDLPVVPVATRHLNARPEGTGDGDSRGFIATRVDLSDVPNRLMIKYIEPSEGNEGTESWGSRGPGESEYGSKDTAEVNLSTLVAWPYDVKNRARSLWRSTHMESHTGQLSLPPSYLDVLPGHIVTYGANDWNIDPVRTIAPEGRVDEMLSLRDILPDSVAINVTMHDGERLTLLDDGNGNLTGWGADVEVVSSSIEYETGRVVLEVRDLLGAARQISYDDPAVVTYRYTKNWVMKVNQSTVNTYDFVSECDLLSTTVDGPLPALDKSRPVVGGSSVPGVPTVYNAEVLDVASMSVGVSPSVSISIVTKADQKTGGWSGASVYSSPNGEDSWTLAGQVTQQSVWGEGEGTLPTTWDHGVTDWTNTITATLFPEGYLENATDEQIESGKNWMLYGDEIIAFHEAVEIEDDEGVVLHGIVRGLRSTDTQDKMTHTGPERLIPLQGLGTFNGFTYEPPGGLAASQRIYHHRIVPSSKTIDDVDTITTRIEGNSALPSRPNLLESDVTVEFGVGATIKWGRRSFAQTTVFGASPLMGGEWERYEVASYDASEVSTLVAAGTSTKDAINQSIKRIWHVGSVSGTSSILNRSVRYTIEEIQEDGFPTDGSGSVAMVVRQVGSFGPSEWSDSQSITPITTAQPAIADPGDASYQSSLFTAAVTTGGTGNAVNPIFVYGLNRRAYVTTLVWNKDDMVEQSWVQYTSDSTERMIVSKAGEGNNISTVEIYPRDAGVLYAIVGGDLVMDIPSNTRLRVEIDGDRGEVLSVFSNPLITAPTTYTDFTDTFKEIALANTSTSYYTALSHGFSDGDAVLITSTGSLPTYRESYAANLPSRNEYDVVYVVNSEINQFQVADSIGGAPLTITSPGSGSMQVQPAEWKDTVNELRFPAGVHKMGRMFRTYDDTKIFLDEGAVVIGSFDVHQSGITGHLSGGAGTGARCEIYGSGTLSGEFNDRDNLTGDYDNGVGYMLFYGRDTSAASPAYRHDNIVSGITLVACPFWLNLGGVCQWKNVSIINPWAYNSDGFRVDGAESTSADGTIPAGNGYITDCYSFSGDDAIHAKHSYNRLTISNTFAIATNNACFHGAYFPHPEAAAYGTPIDKADPLMWLKAYNNHAMHLGLADDDEGPVQAGVPAFGTTAVIRTLTDGYDAANDPTSGGGQSDEGDYNRLFDGMKIWGRCATRPMILGNVQYPFTGETNSLQKQRQGNVEDFQFKNFDWEFEPEQDFRIVSLDANNRVSDITFENWVIGNAVLSNNNYTTWFNIDSASGTMNFDTVIGDPGDSSYESSLFSAALTTGLSSPEPIFVYGRAHRAYLDTLGWEKDDIVEQSWIQYYTDSTEILTISNKSGVPITSAEVYPKNAGVVQVLPGDGNLYLQIPTNTRLRIEINGDRGEVLSVFSNPSIAAPTTYIDFDTLAKDVSLVDTSNNTYTSANHGFSEGDRVLITSTGDVPQYSEALTSEYFFIDPVEFPNVELRTDYEIVFAKVIDSNTFQVSDTPGGPALTIISTGTGTIKAQPGEWTDTVNELRFPPGVHKMGRLFGTADNTKIYFEQGSIVIGSFDVRQTGVIQDQGACDFYGKGILSGEFNDRDNFQGNFEYNKMYSMWYGREERSGLTRHYRFDNTVRGLTVVLAPFYTNLQGVCEWTNVNIINPWAFNADGMRVYGSVSNRGGIARNTCFITDCYSFTGDDAFHCEHSYDVMTISGSFGIATNNGVFHGVYWPYPPVSTQDPYGLTALNNHAMHLGLADDDGVPGQTDRPFGSTAIFRTIVDGYDLANSPANPPYDQVVDGDFNRVFDGLHIWGPVATRPFVVGNVVYPFGGDNDRRARQGHGVIEDFQLKNFVWHELPAQDFRMVALDADNRPSDITFENWTIAGNTVHTGNFGTWFDIDSDVGDLHWDDVTP